MSRIRETAVFGGLPIAEHREQLRCGVAVVDLVSGQTVAKFEFHNGVEEVFAIEVLPQTRNPAVYGPAPDEDQEQDVWIVPPPGNVPQKFEGRSVFAVSTPNVNSMGLADDSNPRTIRGPAAGRTTGIESSQANLSVESAHELAERGTRLHRQGRLAEAVDCLLQSAEKATDPAPALTDLGNVYQDLGNQDRALECYRDAVRHNPSCVPAHQNLGYLLFNHGEPRQALEHYEHATRFAPTALNRLLTASVLPVVYESEDDVRHWRQRMENGLRSMVSDGAKIDAIRQLVPTSFFVAYQGQNDREIMTHLGKLFVGEDCVEKRSAVRTSQRLRVGFLSAYFRDHTIGRLNLGRIQHLSRQDFEVSVLSASRQTDTVSEQFRAAADQYVQLSRDVAEARRQIAALQLDVLIFADVGMDALTSTLAFSRMAPIQCATWGHPDTTGSPYMDYFLSSDLLEITDADAHYSEKLIRLPNLATHFERPVRSGPPRSKDFFGLDPNRRIYLCPQTLFKFHPEFDPILAGILQADPQGDLVILEGRVPNWTAHLKSRFAKTLPDAAQRVHFLPAQPRNEFLALLETADVILDPLHFGGGHTSYEALGLGVPVVTLPGQFLRSRITQALYRRMNLTSPIMKNADDYIKFATELGTNPDARRNLSQQINASSDILFNNHEDVRALEEFLASVVR